jgi:hypothetical protein
VALGWLCAALFLISAFSMSAFALVISAFQLFSFSAFQRLACNAFQLLLWQFQFVLLTSNSPTINHLVPPPLNYQLPNHQLT